MQPHFLVRTKHDKEGYRNLTSVQFLLYQKTHIKWLYLFSVVIGAILWYASYSTGRLSHPVAAVASAVCILAVCLLLVPPVDRFAAKRVRERVLKQTLKGSKADLGKEVLHSFFDEGFAIDGSSGHDEQTYSDIIRLAETEGYYLLFMGKSFCHLLRKGGFETGTAAEFRTFITKASGKEFELVKL